MQIWKNYQLLTQKAVEIKEEKKNILFTILPIQVDEYASFRARPEQDSATQGKRRSAPARESRIRVASHRS